MELLLVTQLLFSLGVYFCLGGIGGLSKELYNLISEKTDKISFIKILIAAIVTMFIMISIEAWLIPYSIGLVFGTSFLTGILGVEIFGNIDTIKKATGFFRNIFKTVKEFKEFKNSTKGGN